VKYARNNRELFPIRKIKNYSYVGFGKTQGKKPLVRPRSSWENNIKMHLGGIKREAV
jgi:hypothetical protein